VGNGASPSAQSWSIPSCGTSVTPGWIAGLESLQSGPPKLGTDEAVAVQVAVRQRRRLGRVERDLVDVEAVRRVRAGVVLRLEAQHARAAGELAPHRA
jgi:hypothetical protein